MPPGRTVTIPGRGDTWVWEAPGPAGAPTLLLLHGWMSTAALNWHGVFEELGRSFRVVAPDHRGHGRGLRGPGEFSLEACADDLAALIDTLELPPVIAVGYSMGGPIACLLWRRHPKLVDGLVLCATAARFAGRPELSPVVQVVGRGMAWAVNWVPTNVVRDGYGLVSRLRGRPVDPEPEPWVRAETEGGSPAAFIQAATALNGYDATSWMASIDTPTAVVVTTEDAMVSPDRQRWLADAIPGAKTFEVHGSHRACVDNAEEFSAAVRDACLDVFARGGSGGRGGAGGGGEGGVAPEEPDFPTPEPA